MQCFSKDVRAKSCRKEIQQPLQAVFSLPSLSDRRKKTVQLTKRVQLAGPQLDVFPAFSQIEHRAPFHEKICWGSTEYPAIRLP